MQAATLKVVTGAPAVQSFFETETDKRKQLVWEIERKLADDGARPIIFYSRFAYCWTDGRAGDQSGRAGDTARAG